MSLLVSRSSTRKRLTTPLLSQQKRTTLLDNDLIMMPFLRLALATATIWGVSVIPFVNSVKVGDKVSAYRGLDRGCSDILSIEGRVHRDTNADIVGAGCSSLDV